MKKILAPSTSILLCLVCVCCESRATSPSHPPFQVSTLPPPDLMEMVRLAIEHGQAEDAAAAFIVAMAYSAFDAKRTGTPVPRKVFADLAATVLSSLPPEQLTAFATAGRALSSNPQRILGILSEAGYPVYNPEYLGESATLSPGFAPESAWNEVVTNLSQGGLVPK